MQYNSKKKVLLDNKSLLPITVVILPDMNKLVSKKVSFLVAKYTSIKLSTDYTWLVN